MCFLHPFPLSHESSWALSSLALKAWMVETTHSISLLNLRKGYPSAAERSVSQNETYFCAPRKNVWWNQDTNMKTARHPLWNRSWFRETAISAEKQTCPQRVPGGVWPPKSDTSPSSAFLLIRNSGASPAPFLYTPSHSNPPFTFLFLPRSPPLLVFTLLVLYLLLFSTFSFCFLSSPPVTLPSAFFFELTHTLVFTPLPHFRCWKTAGWGGWGVLFF